MPPHSQKEEEAVIFRLLGGEENIAAGLGEVLLKGH